jgi:DNA polymerase I-like protein with 3'-5' exonuclease and polymerase domains
MTKSLFGSNCKSYNYKNDVPEFIANADKRCLPFNVKIRVPDTWKKSKCRVLCVIEHVDSADIEKKRLCSATYGTVLENVFGLAEDYVRHLDVPKYEIAVANFNFFRTYHIKDVKLRNQADQAAATRIRKLVKTLQPHKVIIFGDNAAEQLLPNVENIRLLRGHKHKIDGVEYYSSIDPSVGYSKSRGDDDEDGNVSDLKEETTLKYCNLLGYVSRTVAAALIGKIPYPIDVVPNPVLVDSIKKFDKLYKRLMSEKVIACDIETEDLSRVTNRLLTIQFAFDSKTGYVLPILHKDSPFSKEELSYIRKRLRRFFNKQRDYLLKQYDDYIIGQNFKFDMSVLRHWLKINQVLWPIWDLQSGEYALDENIVTLKDKSKFGTSQYNLLQISLNYGCFAYLQAKFGKSERHTISQVDLSRDVLEYCALDVQVPFAIHEQQLARAKHQNFAKTSYQESYKRFVVTQMSNMVHITSQMEQRGACIDLPYLMKMRSSKGPLEQLLAEKLAKFKKSKAALRANKLVLKKTGAPSGSIYETIGAKTDNWVLNLNKPIHKQILFIDVLGLKASRTTASGAPQIDKYFMAAYKDAVPEAALYDEYSQLLKLSGTYIGAFARRYKEEKDFRSDGHLRPSFGFVETATGRGNSYDPNLQNIPTRGKFAKMIKRSFVSPHGSLRLKMDYSAHEVRVWAIIAGDELLAALFQRGRELRQKFRSTEDPKYKALMDTIGDIHKLNCQFFFGVEPAEVTKEQRDSIKNVVFGSIYGRSAGSIGKVINKDKEYVEKLLDRFFDRFKKASAWLKWAKRHSVQHNYVYSPIGRVRHMYAHLYGMQGLVAATERRGSNAPIQGFAADMGHTAAYIYGIHLEQVFQRFDRMDGLLVPGGVSIMVHDSLFGDMNYRNYLVALQIMQWSATLGCEQYYETHFGVKYPVHLEVEFELGADDSRLIKWDWSETQLKQAIEQSLVYQTDIYPKLDVKKTLKEIYAVRNDTKVMRYLDKHYPILAD